MTKRDPNTRFKEHYRSGTDRAYLEYRVLYFNLNKFEARKWEQFYINKYGLIKDGGKLLNLRNEIDPKYWDLYNIRNLNNDGNINDNYTGAW